MTSKHVLIVGCGPAGSACAITARRHGMQVTVVDKAVFPRDKCCGDGLTTGALHLIEELGVKPSDIPSWKQIEDIYMQAPDGRTIELPLPKENGQFAAITARVELDMALHDRAIELGVNVIEGVGIVAVTQGESNVRITLDSGESLTGDYLVAADGMWSPTKKIICGPTDADSSNPYLGQWHAFRQYISDVTGPAKDRLYVWFEPDLLPGYVWSFPLGDGRVNFGFGILRGGNIEVRDMRWIWPQLLQRPHIMEKLGGGYKLIDRHLAWPIPAQIDKTVLSKDRTLFVGDAACAPDPMTGEGIGQAVLTGMLAAKAIAVGTNPQQTSALYEEGVRKSLVADHRMSLLLGKLLAHTRTTNWALWLTDRSNWTRRNFARWMFEDEPRAILLTPRRWHRRFFKRSGAYHELEI